MSGVARADDFTGFSERYQRDGVRSKGFSNNPSLGPRGVARLRPSGWGCQSSVALRMGSQGAGAET
jgi:hypothetical protein